MDPDLLERIVPWIFLPGWRTHPLEEEVERAEVWPPTGQDSMYRAVLGQERTSAHREAELAEAVGRLLHLRLASSSPFVFVHAGVVVLNGRALVLPGRSFGGKSTLVKALVDQGAHYYSDEYAVLDAEGNLYPFPRPLMLRQPERHSLALPMTGPDRCRVDMIIRVEHRPNAALELAPCSAGESAMTMFSHAVAARQLGGRATAILARVASEARVHLGGIRGEAGEAARYLLRMSSD